MIVTLTLNPGLDLTYTLAEAAVGQVDVHRATTTTTEASGKGVNVSRALHLHGQSTIAILPLGGPTGRHLSDLLAAESVPQRGIAQETPTRVNTTLTLRGGGTAKVNGPGGELTNADLLALTHEIENALRDAVSGELWLAICGSLPPGVDPARVGDFVALAHAHGAKCAVDASGEALTAAISAGPDLIAPNRLELAEVDPLAAEAESIEALATVTARIARDTGTGVLVSLGADGALFTQGGSAIHGNGPTLTPINTAGAGDALLSGWLAGAGTPSDRLARALRWGRAACRSATTVAAFHSDISLATDPITVEAITVDPVRDHPARSRYDH